MVKGRDLRRLSASTFAVFLLLTGASSFAAEQPLDTPEETANHEETAVDAGESTSAPLGEAEEALSREYERALIDQRECPRLWDRYRMRASICRVTGGVLTGCDPHVIREMYEAFTRRCVRSEEHTSE